MANPNDTQIGLLAPTGLKAIPSETPADKLWKVYVNGVEQRNVESVVVISPTLDTLAYACHPAGYATWVFAENGGGGVVIVPFIERSGQVYLGLVRQMRLNQGVEAVLNLPRGHLDPGETHFQAAEREGSEEIGDFINNYELFELGGQPANPNSAFFVTAPQTPSGGQRGVCFYGLRFPSECVTDVKPYQLRPGVIAPTSTSKTSKLAEQILGCEFLPCHEAAQLGDMFTVAGVARLNAHLLR